MLAHHFDERLVDAAYIHSVRLAFVRADDEWHNLFHHFREDRDQVAVAEAEDSVQVHGGAGLWQAGDDHFLDGALGEQVLRELADGLARGALTHADEHDAIADRHHITAFERGIAMVLVRVAIPHLEVGLGERLVELVDGGGQQGFLATRRPVHRVQRHAAVDPAGGVAGELGVGQRWQDEAGVAQVVVVHLHDFGAFALRQVLACHAADQEFGQVAWLQAFEPAAHFVGQAYADGVRGDLAVEDPLEGLFVLHDIGQQVVHLQHIHTTLAHLGDEVEMVTLGLVDPDHIVEQQFITVARRQALVRQARGANHHFAQFAGFGVDTVLLFFSGHGFIPPIERIRGSKGQEAVVQAIGCHQGANDHGCEDQFFHVGEDRFAHLTLGLGEQDGARCVEQG
ncbi:hypothetical protein D3C79_652210 [compost metagenome]